LPSLFDLDDGINNEQTSIRVLAGRFRELSSTAAESETKVELERRGAGGKHGGQRSCRIYVRTIITLPQARRALLELVAKSFLKANLMPCLQHKAQRGRVK
jgi:hypothetical protein